MRKEHEEASKQSVKDALKIQADELKRKEVKGKDPPRAKTQEGTEDLPDIDMPLTEEEEQQAMDEVREAS